jgi:glycosyltransferase involved in cell wall biosynthesis
VTRRILVLAPFPPRLDAHHGGGRVIASLVCGLAERHDVALVYLRGADDAPLDDEVRARCDVVAEVGLAASSAPWRKRLSRVSKLWGALPDRAARVSSDEFRARACAVAAEWRPHVVQAEFVEMAQYLDSSALSPAARVIVDHDPGARAAADFSDTAGGLRRLSRRLDAYAWRRYSRRMFERADRVVVFTERDRSSVDDLVEDARVVTIPIAVELPAPPVNSRGDGSNGVLFYGGFLHPPNSDAALRLMHTIVPCVRTSHPDLVLELVGANPTAEMVRHASDGVRLRGSVPSVAPYLERAAVVAVPITLGGGMRVKVLETLAAGKALVASRRAVEGLAVKDGHEFVLAETDEEFCAAISSLLADPARREALGRRARAWAERNLDPAAVAAAYERLYGELAGERE